jgi:hypothetical protein
MELTQIPVEKFTTEAALDTEFYLLPGGQVLVLTPGAEPVAFHSVKAEAGGMGFYEACFDFLASDEDPDDDDDPTGAEFYA